MEACNYPGTLDADCVERNLHEYMRALGVDLKLQRLARGWMLNDHPALMEYTQSVLEDFYRRQGNDSKPLSFDETQKFAAWCIQSSDWRRWWQLELSWLSTTYLGVLETGDIKVQSWSRPVFEAFIAGAWLLHWTKDTLYWVSKPTVVTEQIRGRRRLHCADGPALVSDVEDLFFWHGVIVPQHVVLEPQKITIAQIEDEPNAERRRVLIERYGMERYVRDSNSQLMQEIEASYSLVGLRGARLYRKEVPGDEPIICLDMVNSSPEPDGSVKRYMIRVDPNAYGGLAAKNCLAAMASTYRMPDGSLLFRTPDDYHPELES